MNEEVRWLSDDRYLNLAGHASLTLTFAVDLFQSGDRYRSLDVERLKDRIETGRPDLYNQAIKPCVSFFDDILNARSEATSQQITFLLTGAATPSVHIISPASFDFTAEGERFHVDRRYRAESPLPCELQEAATLFSNGLLFLNATFVFPEAGRWEDCGSEYDLFTLQKIVSPTEECVYLRDTMEFSHEGSPKQTLIALLNARLRQSLATEGTIMNEIFSKRLGPNGIKVPDLSWAHLHSSALFINSADVFHAVETFIADETIPANEHLRLLAGLVQNIADFRRQDDSEVRESLRPIRSDGVLSIYCHPKFIAQFNRNSRTYLQARDTLGTCPYFYLTQVFAAYREKLADTLDGYIEQIAYGVRSDAVVNNRYMKDHVDLLQYLDAPLLGAGGDIVRKFARIRLGLFRDFFSRMPPNTFRYENERVTLDNILESRGIVDRIDAGLAVFNEHEKCVKDIHAFGEQAAEKQIGRFLLILAVLGVVEVCANIAQLMGMPAVPAYLRITAYAVALAGVAYLMLRLGSLAGSLGAVLLKRSAR